MPKILKKFFLFPEKLLLKKMELLNEKMEFVIRKTRDEELEEPGDMNKTNSITNELMNKIKIITEVRFILKFNKNWS